MENSPKKVNVTGIVLGGLAAVAIVLGLSFYDKLPMIGGELTSRNVKAQLKSEHYLYELAKMRPSETRIGLKNVAGLRVNYIHPEGIFKEFGLQVGDLILKVNDKEAFKKKILVKELEESAGKKTIKMRVLRDKQAVMISKTLD